ncbi:fimbria/pilus outer membrane usher protein [Rosenbergiella epipactidis]|uniref:fimbria/pilus outer membrane usher protein n=1 Tax=Rosenbergiella epipactidis TaxID=1544694 RepID=UPI001F4D99F7|nr:fimbria/pilus outer membrane usher protein [Rosenbergiella epipactidis]
MDYNIIKKSSLVAAIIPFSYSNFSHADEFNMSFVHGVNNVSSVSSVASGDTIQPGTYPFDIYLNQRKIDSLKVTFVRSNNEIITPCFDAEQLAQYGIKLPESSVKSHCISIDTQIPDSKIHVDVNNQKIELTIPQTQLINTPKGTVPKRLWDNGINAGFINYNYNFSHNKYKYNDNSSTENYSYLALNNGINIGSIRLRQNGSLTHNSYTGTHWTNIASWAETDIISLRSRLLVGQSSTNSSVFDSFQFRGAQISSVEDMLPDSMRNYAPVVRGVAHSNARVSIRQNGYLVYSTNVSAGPFAIHDVYPNSSGTLYVTVTEADGTETHFEVPYASVANMLREGIWSYQVTAGRYNDGLNGYSPNFIQGTVSSGTSYNLTPYGGAIVADNYRSAVAGVGTSLGNLGALSVDATYAVTNLASGSKQQGQSYRVLYSKSLNTYGTDFRLAGYRYSTSGYYDLSDAVNERRDWKQGYYETDYTDPNKENSGTPSWAQKNNSTYTSSTYSNKRQRMEVSLSQSLGEYGSIYVNGSQQRYWNTSGSSRTAQLGYNGQSRRINYGIYWQTTKTQYGYSDNSVNVVLSIPLNVDSSNTNTTMINTQLAHSRQNGDSYNTGVSGTLLEDSRLSYGLSTGKSQGSDQNSAANIAYRSNIGNGSASYSYSNNYQQGSLSASGGIVLHSGGVILSQPLSDTFALVKAKDADGTNVINSPGVKVNRSGYAVVSSVTPYRYNAISLNTEHLGPGLDIPESTLQVVPTHGAIVQANFQTYYGHSLLIHTSLVDGSKPQLGASVLNQKGVNSGTVGTDGVVFVSGITSDDKLRLKWGENADQQCLISIPDNLPPMKDGEGYQELTLQCHPDKG